MDILFQELAKKYRTPKQIQNFINTFNYNHESDGPTQKSALMTLKTGVAHCMEGALLAAAIMEYHLHPPLFLSLESVDKLDHLVFLFHENGRWGTIGKSREPGLGGRAPIFRSVRDLSWSYVDPYVEETGRVKGYQVIDISKVQYNWRFSKKNLWALEQYFIQFPHKKLKASNTRHDRVLRNPPTPQNFWW